MGKPALRWGGGASSLIAGYLGAPFLQIPNGFPQETFFYIAILAAFAGFELGTFVGGLNRLVYGALAVLAAIVSFFAYYWIFYGFTGGLWPSFFVLLLYGFTFFVLFVGLGIFGIQLLELGEQEPATAE